MVGALRRREDLLGADARLGQKAREGKLAPSWSTDPSAAPQDDSPMSPRGGELGQLGDDPLRRLAAGDFQQLVEWQVADAEVCLALGRKPDRVVVDDRAGIERAEPLGDLLTDA